MSNRQIARALAALLAKVGTPGNQQPIIAIIDSEQISEDDAAKTIRAMSEEQGYGQPIIISVSLDLSDHPNHPPIESHQEAIQIFGIEE